MIRGPIIELCSDIIAVSYIKKREKKTIRNTGVPVLIYIAATGINGIIFC